MADADVVSLLSTLLLFSLFVADLIVGMEELELHYRRRGRYNFRKIKIATISVRMVPSQKNMLTKGEMLNMLDLLDVWGEAPPPFRG